MRKNAKKGTENLHKIIKTTGFRDHEMSLLILNHLAEEIQQVMDLQIIKNS